MSFRLATGLIPQKAEWSKIYNGVYAPPFGWHTDDYMAELPKQYSPQENEDRIYKLWEESGFFNPDVAIEKGVTAPDAETFSIVLPPPNVTGTLHMGHAAMLAVEDIFVRFWRMRGRRTLWIPGTDHAAIATQSKVEKQIFEEEKITRTEMGREKFLSRVEEFAQASHDTIVNQVRKMGSSVDWSREAYTLDEPRSTAVRTAFKTMYDAGIIYRGSRIVNWDPEGATTVSDDEVVYKETKGVLYTFRYSKDFPFAISTTRPETKFGDTAVAVHPDDTRYQQYIGQTFSITFVGYPIEVTVIADSAVNPEFGTGALGVTPAHSVVDWEIAQRHNLPLKQVIDERGHVDLPASVLSGSANAQWLQESVNGLYGKKARKAIIEALREEGLLEKEEEVDQNIATAERTGGVIEPMPKLQWWIDVNKPFALADSHINGIESNTETTLKEVMRKAVSGGQINILPARFEKTYYHWIDNLRDWNISRQIWYGHRVPVWYRSTTAHGEPELYCGVEAPDGEGWEQDPDTLDTWFSSGMWTFSTLGWPESTKDLATYHPTTLLETGYDILFFWIARMVLMSGYFMGSVPFSTVYLHGLVRDEKGRKMSKSLGNIIDPLDLIKKYGADATRLSLIVGASPGTDLKLSEERVRGYQHFANKLWNITRFVLMRTEDFQEGSVPILSESDETILAAFADMACDVTGDIESYRLHLASEKLYHYAWHTFADEVLEESKPLLDNETTKHARQYVLRVILRDLLKLLHPFIPFVTETIWQELPFKERELLMVEQWPSFPDSSNS